MLWAIVAVRGGVVNLAIAAVSWRGRVSYQRARAAPAVAVAVALAAGGAVHDEQPDDAFLHVVVPGWQEARHSPGTEAGDQVC
jgi:hypothetical protein